MDFLLCVYLPVCLCWCHMCVKLVLDKRKALGPVELKLQMILSRDMGAGN